MSDTLGDFNLLPVALVDGQAPTARYFNAAFGQIETAFELLSQVIGDFDATGEGESTYVPSLIRAFGNMGWINCRLPANLRVPAGDGGGTEGDLPFIIEELDENFLGKKEACLTFLPAVTSATHADVTDTNLGTGVVTGTPITQNLGVAGRFILDGKRVLTSTAIISPSSIQYPIDTGADNFRDSYGPETGANVVPSIPQIFSGTAALCTITQPAGYEAGEYRIDFPPVTRIMNPRVPFSTEEGLDAATDIVQLDANGVSPVRWAGTVPKYPIPEKILNLASGTLLPYNMVSLWFHNGTTVARVRPTLTNDQFRWNLIPGTVTAIKVTTPLGFVLPAAPEDEGDNRYVVCFAGTSVADALLHERARALLHSHDGNDGTPIEAMDLFERFNPSHWFHSTKAYNHFPQYLERGGLNRDTLNRQNAILGVLHLGPTSATESNTATASSVGADSWALSFGHISAGPSFSANASDMVLETGTSGKLQLANTGLRINTGNFFLGLEDGQEIGFDLDQDAEPHPILDIRKYSGGVDEGYATTQLGQLYVTGGHIGFDNRDEADAPSIVYAPEGDLFVWDVLAEEENINTRLRVGGIVTNFLNAENVDGPIFELVPVEAFMPFYGNSTDFLADGNLGFEGGTADISDFTYGELLAGQSLVRRGPFGEAPFGSDSRGIADFWEMQDQPEAGPNYQIRILIAKVKFPGALSRQRLSNTGHTPTVTVTGVKGRMKTDGAVVAADGDALFLKLFRVRTTVAGVWGLNGDSANAETIYRNELTEGQVGALANGDGFLQAPFDGGAVGDHIVDFDYEYYLFIAVQGPLDIDFYGCELTLETDLVA